MFSKNDLKPGMLIITCEGTQAEHVIVERPDGSLCALGRNGFIDIYNYNDDLIIPYLPSLNIKEVYGFTKYATVFDNILDPHLRELIWKRDETMELTLDQIAEKFNIPVSQLKIKKQICHE